MPPCTCGHSPEEHSHDGCSECDCIGYDPDNEYDQEEGYVFD